MMLRVLISLLAAAVHRRPESSSSSSSSSASRMMEPSNSVPLQTDKDDDDASNVVSLPTTTRPTEATCRYYEPPPGSDDHDDDSYYSDNPSVFGRILRGELPAVVYDETPTVLAFEDRTPRAPLHILVIPKRYIPTVASLVPQDIPMLEEMRPVGMTLIAKHEPEALANNDYILCYHIPPFNSVDHLHLHVLAPASQMKCWFRHGKYQVGTPWCADDVTIRQRLAAGRKPI